MVGEGYGVLFHEMPYTGMALHLGPWICPKFTSCKGNALGL
jgi:hypothetical protein